jgi:uncharacterized protein YkwD
MRRFIVFIFLLLFGFLPVISSCQNKEYTSNKNSEELSAWDDPIYLAANSAKDADYLTEEEKQVFYYLNLVRMNPKLFAETYLRNLKNSNDSYESSLYSELQILKPLPVLQPNRKLFESAECHAKESGKRGVVTHKRYECTEYFMGECCYYGKTNSLGIVSALLIDQGVKSLGHRNICLDAGYTELGVSIQPHKTYEENCVLDFR